MLYSDLIALVMGYLIGSVSFAVVVSRAMGLPDPTTYGSGNPGATNVLRTGSKKAAILTLVGDALKGTAAVLIAQKLFGTSWAVGLAMLGAFLGHLYPVFHKFKGGKGVATAGGAAFGVSLALGGAMVAVWLLVAFATRYSSLASIAAAIASPFVASALFGGAHPVTLCVIPLALLILYRHHGNIAKLRSGTESKIGDKKSPTASS